MIYPHYFVVIPNPGFDEKPEPERHLVVIAHTGYTSIYTAWMNDSDLPQGDCFVPDVDIIHEKHFFDSELEALQFIKEWWSSFDPASMYT